MRISLRSNFIILIISIFGFAYSETVTIGTTEWKDLAGSTVPEETCNGVKYAGGSVARDNNKFMGQMI